MPFILLHIIIEALKTSIYSIALALKYPIYSNGMALKYPFTVLPSASKYPFLLYIEKILHHKQHFKTSHMNPSKLTHFNSVFDEVSSSYPRQNTR